MEIIKHYFTKNECYIRGKKHTVKGCVVHSTGANNPKLNRYIDMPDILGPNKYGNHWDQYQPGGRQVCVHGFVGLDKDDKVRTIQTLPWDMVGWHVGGKGNNMGYVGFEICEDGLTDPVYFNNVMNEAQELCAYLMETYHFGIDDVISHHEAHLKGIGSNHGDIDHWLKLHGKNMKWFRDCVMKKFNALNEPAKPTKPTKPAQPKPDNGLPAGVESYNGFVEITYAGKDGINLHSKPTFNGSVSDTVYKGTVLTVIGRIKVDGVWMYYTKAKHYVTGSTKYVSFRTSLHGDSKPAPKPVSPYYPKYTGPAASLDSMLKDIGVPEKFRGSWSKRKPLASANGVRSYTGTETQNTKLKQLALQGKLKKV